MSPPGISEAPSATFTHDKSSQRSLLARAAGQRHAAVDIPGLCEHLDLTVGPKVAEVVVNQHEFRQGKDDAANIIQEKPEAAIQEILDSFANADNFSGVGVVKVAIPEAFPGPVDVEISNPCVKRTTAAAKPFLFSYWCGLFTQLLGKELDSGGNMRVPDFGNQNEMPTRKTPIRSI